MRYENGVVNRDETGRDELGDGDRLPNIRVPPPGPESRRHAEQLARWEAPGINTLNADGVTCVWQSARGANVLDADGNRFIDLTAGFGVAGVGHRHPTVTRAIAAQSAQLLHGLGDAASHPLRAPLARALCRHVPIDDPQVYWAVSGADAIELAIKTSLLATGRHNIAVFDPSYHGMTLGALAASSRPRFRQPSSPHLHSHIRRAPYGCAPDQVEALLEDRTVAAVLVEPTIGREGVRLPPPGWLPALASRCRQFGSLLIVDEIFTGLGRTGKWFDIDHERVTPDLLCCGKALAGGLPIGAVVGSRALMAAWKSPGEARHTATFVAHPLACATALATLEVLEQEQIPARAARMGPLVADRIHPWPERFPSLAAIHGRGLLWGLVTREPAQARQLAHRAYHQGLLMLAGGAEGNVVQLVPPLVITERQLHTALTIIESILENDFDTGDLP